MRSVGLVEVGQNSDAKQQQAHHDNLDAMPQQTPSAATRPKNQQSGAGQRQITLRIGTADRQQNPNQHGSDHQSKANRKTEFHDFHASIVWLF